MKVHKIIEKIIKASIKKVKSNSFSIFKSDIAPPINAI
jgi:hypothetical protein